MFKLLPYELIVYLTKYLKLNDFVSLTKTCNHFTQFSIKDPLIYKYFNNELQKIYLSLTSEELVKLNAIKGIQYIIETSISFNNKKISIWQNRTFRPNRTVKYDTFIDISYIITKIFKLSINLHNDYLFSFLLDNYFILINKKPLIKYGIYDKPPFNRINLKYKNWFEYAYIEGNPYCIMRLYLTDIFLDINYEKNYVMIEQLLNSYKN